MKLTRMYTYLLMLILLVPTVTYSQSYGRIESQKKQNQPSDEEIMESFSESVALEKAVNPDLYILGPGDELGVNIVTSENMTLPVTVTPTGDLFIPAVGVIHVAGKTLSEAIRVVQAFINKNAFPGAKVNIALTRVRTFKIQIEGAVNEPGFIVVHPLERLSDIIEKCDGFHQLAQEYQIEITKASGKSLTINYLDYLRKGDLTQNPVFTEGDRIHVPFGDITEEGIVLRGAVSGAGYDMIEASESLWEFLQRRVRFHQNADLESVMITRKAGESTRYVNVEPDKFDSVQLKPGDVVDILWEKGVMVNGFVLSPGSFAFSPGYIAADYINMAGGNTTEGAPEKCIVQHRDGSQEVGQDVVVKRGDVIVVPRTFKSVMVGDISLLQAITSLATLVLTFVAATK